MEAAVARAAITLALKGIETTWTLSRNVKRNKKFARRLAERASAFKVVLLDLKASRCIDEEKVRGVQELQVALEKAVVFLEKADKRSWAEALYHRSIDDHDKMDMIDLMVKDAAELLSVSLTINEAQVLTERLEDVVDLLQEMGEAHIQLHAETRDMVHASELRLQDCIQQEMRKQALQQTTMEKSVEELSLSVRAGRQESQDQTLHMLEEMKRELDQLSLSVRADLSRPETEPCRSEVGATSVQKSKYRANEVVPGTSTTMMERVLKNVTQFRVENPTLTLWDAGAMALSSEFKRQRNEEANQQFLKSLCMVMNVNTKVILLGKDGIPDMLLNLFNGREVMSSFRSRFVRCLQVLAEDPTMTAMSKSVEHALWSLIELDQCDTAYMRYDFDEEAKKIRGSVASTVDPPPTGLVGLVGISSAGEMYARFAGGMIWCEIGQWKWKRCRRDTERKVRVLVPVNCGKITREWLVNFHRLCGENEERKMVMTNLAVLVPYFKWIGIEEFRRDAKPDRRTLRDIRSNRRDESVVEAELGAAKFVEDAYSVPPLHVPDLTENYLSLDELREVLGKSDISDEDLSCAFSVHTTENISVNTITQIWGDSRNLPHREETECASFGLAAAFIRSQVTKQSASDQLGVDNPRFGYTTLKSKLGTTLTWPGSNALLVTTDGMAENILDRAEHHGMSERQEPFPLLSFSAICIAGGVNTSKEKFDAVANEIAQRPLTLMQPRYLCRNVFTNECIRTFDLVQAMETVSSPDEELFVRNSSIRYAVCELFAGGARMLEGEMNSFVHAVEYTVEAEFESEVTVKADCLIPLGGLRVEEKLPNGRDSLWNGNQNAVVFSLKDRKPSREIWTLRLEPTKKVDGKDDDEGISNTVYAGPR